MKNALLAAGVLLALSGTAHAQIVRPTAGGTSPLYGELGYSYLDANGSSAGADLSGHPGMIRGIVGYQVHPNAAIEGLLGIGIHDSHHDGTVLGLNYNSNFRVRSTVGLFAKPKLDFGNFEVFGRVGYAQTRLRTNLTIGAANSGSNTSNGDFAYGLGANWRFNPRVYAGLDLMRYYDRGQTRIDGVTLSVGTRW
jgi:opacity protein-like surface antigen